MLKDVTIYTGKLVRCTPKGNKVNILLATRTKTEIVRDGLRKKQTLHRHIGYNSWALPAEDVPYLQSNPQKFLERDVSLKVSYKYGDMHASVDFV